MAKITPFLWFNDTAEEAMNFYVSVFPNSRVDAVIPGPNGKAMGVTAVLDGQEVRALNGGPMFTPNESFSFFVDCKDQDEVDQYWNAFLTHGGQESQCGWLKDKYGFSWQIIPTHLGQLLSQDKTGKVMQAMLKMKKIIIADLEAAAK